MKHVIMQRIWSYLQNRGYKQKVRDAISFPYVTQTGVPQGNILGSTLFYDLPKVLDCKLVLALRKIPYYTTMVSKIVN